MKVDFVSLGLCIYQDKFVVEKKKWGWSIPGGHVEEEENLEETLVREIREEMEVEIEEFYTIFPNPVYSDGKVTANPIFSFEYIASSDAGKPHRHRNLASVFVVTLKSKPKSKEDQELAFLSYDEFMKAEFHPIVENIKPAIKLQSQSLSDWNKILHN